MNKEIEAFDAFLASGDPIIGISDEQRDWIATYITTLRTAWLRSEIEKLEGMEKLTVLVRYPNENYIYNQALTSIITRYKEELKELESK